MTPWLYCTVCVQFVLSTTNIRRTHDETWFQRTLNKHWSVYIEIMQKCRPQASNSQTWKNMSKRRRTIPFVFAQKPTNFGSWWTVWKLFTDGAAHVGSPVHTYAHFVHKPFTNSLACKCIAGFWHWPYVYLRPQYKLQLKS